MAQQTTKLIIMEQYLVTYETARLAFNVGFNEPCIYYAWTDFKNPTMVEESVLQSEFHTQKCSIQENVDNTQFTISIPFQFQLQKWLREEYKIIVFVTPCWNDDDSQEGYLFEICRVNINYDISHTDKAFKNYEEALEEGLYEALKMI